MEPKQRTHQITKEEIQQRAEDILGKVHVPPDLFAGVPDIVTVNVPFKPAALFPIRGADRAQVRQRKHQEEKRIYQSKRDQEDRQRRRNYRMGQSAAVARKLRPKEEGNGRGKGL